MPFKKILNRIVPFASDRNTIKSDRSLIISPLRCVRANLKDKNKMAIKTIIILTTILQLLQLISTQQITARNSDSKNAQNPTTPPIRNITCDCEAEKENVIILKEFLERLENEYTGDPEVSTIGIHGLAAYEPCLHCLNYTSDTAHKLKNTFNLTTSFNFSDPNVNSTGQNGTFVHRIKLSDIARENHDQSGVPFGESGVPFDESVVPQSDVTGEKAKTAYARPSRHIHHHHHHHSQEGSRLKRQAICPSGYVRVNRYCIDKSVFEENV